MFKKSVCVTFFVTAVLVFAGGGSLAHAKFFDFGIKDVGILPISPLYFLKEWRRDLVRAFTKDTIAQVSLELRIVNEKAAEFKKVEELRPNDMSAIKDALEVYKKASDSFMKKLQKMEIDMKEKEAGGFLGEFFENAITHKKFLEDISVRYAEKKEISKLADETKKQIQNTEKIVSEEIPARVLETALSRTFGNTTTTLKEMIEQGKNLAENPGDQMVADIETDIITADILSTDEQTENATNTTSGQISGQEDELFTQIQENGGILNQPVR